MSLKNKEVTQISAVAQGEDSKPKAMSLVLRGMRMWIRTSRSGSVIESPYAPVMEHILAAVRSFKHLTQQDEDEGSGAEGLGVHSRAGEATSAGGGPNLHH